MHEHLSLHSESKDFDLSVHCLYCGNSKKCYGKENKTNFSYYACQSNGVSGDSWKVVQPEMMSGV